MGARGKAKAKPQAVQTPAKRKAPDFDHMTTCKRPAAPRRFLPPNLDTMVRKAINDHFQHLSLHQLDEILDSDGFTLRQRLRRDKEAWIKDRSCVSFGALYYRECYAIYTDVKALREALKPEAVNGKMPSPSSKLMQACDHGLKHPPDFRPVECWLDAQQPDKVAEVDLVIIFRYMLDVKVGSSIKKVRHGQHVLRSLGRLNLLSKHPKHVATMRDVIDNVLVKAWTAYSRGGNSMNDFCASYAKVWPSLVAEAELKAVLAQESSGQWHSVESELNKVMEGSAWCTKMLSFVAGPLVYARVKLMIEKEVATLMSKKHISEEEFNEQKSKCLESLGEVPGIEALNTRRTIHVKMQGWSIELVVGHYSDDANLHLNAALRTFAVQAKALTPLPGELEMSTVTLAEDATVEATLVIDAEAARKHIRDQLCFDDVMDADSMKAMLHQQRNTLMETDEYHELDAAFLGLPSSDGGVEQMQNYFLAKFSADGTCSVDERIEAAEEWVGKVGKIVPSCVRGGFEAAVDQMRRISVGKAPLLCVSSTEFARKWHASLVNFCMWVPHTDAAAPAAASDAPVALDLTQCSGVLALQARMAWLSKQVLKDVSYDELRAFEVFAAWVPKDLDKRVQASLKKWGELKQNQVVGKGSAVEKAACKKATAGKSAKQQKSASASLADW
mmetsp:Transcript_45042/g.107005  ORF Transcript_45042/g.107005 Transcript_45042/m.107005 type:complete len:672 (+) Transcript_45042:81-2096(+)